MTEEKQQIALCEWVGYKMQNHPDVKEKVKTFTMPEKWILDPECNLVFRHDLLNTSSLDVLHEMEKKLTDEQCVTYHNLLKAAHLIATHPAAEWIFHMSAPQRREALLRTLGLWEDAP